MQNTRKDTVLSIVAFCWPCCHLLAFANDASVSVGDLLSYLGLYLCIFSLFDFACFCLSASMSLCPYLFFCVCVSLSFLLSFCLWIFTTMSAYFFIFQYVCLCLSLSLSVCATLLQCPLSSLSLCLFVSVSRCLFSFLISMPSYIPVSVLFLPCSLCPISVCLSVLVYLIPGICLSPHHSFLQCRHGGGPRLLFGVFTIDETKALPTPPCLGQSLSRLWDLASLRSPHGVGQHGY